MHIRATIGDLEIEVDCSGMLGTHHSVLCREGDKEKKVEGLTECEAGKIVGEFLADGDGENIYHGEFAKHFSEFLP